MHKVKLVLTCCCLAACGSCSKEAPDDTAGPLSKTALSYREQQERLFHEIDHKLVYQGCQELFQLHKEGKLSATAYFCQDPETKLSELPQSIRQLQPTYVQVNRMMTTMGFLNEGRVQVLLCSPDELTQAMQSPSRPKGWGYRANGPTERLSGTESLDYLNKEFFYFETEITPGLGYGTQPPGTPRTLDEIAREMKRAAEQNADPLTMMEKMICELAVKRQRLLHRTDHQELLRACRDTMKRFAEGVFATAEIYVIPPELREQMRGTVEYESSADNLKHIPQIILDLEPGYILLGEKSLTVALAGGLDHAGVFAYMNEQEAVPRDDDMELIPGLRYYDDGIREVGEGYKRYLQSLKDEAIPYAQWASKQPSLPPPDTK